MSFHSEFQIQQRTDSEPLDSPHLKSPLHSFNHVSINTFTASQFGLDFSHVPLHANETQPVLPSRRAPLTVQRFPENGGDISASCPTCPEAEATEAAPAPAPGSEPETEPPTPGETPASGLIVEDSAEEVGPGQMRKSEFLAQLRAEVCRTIETAIAGSGRSTDGCPYVGHWFDFYSRQDSAHLERAIHKYAPEAANATTAREYISAITQRARQSAETWARTGEITGVPEGIPVGLPGMGLLGSIGGLISGIGSIFFKARKGGARAADNPQAIQAELGEGRPLEGNVRSRMESAFGMDFAHVRTHTDTTAARLSDRLNARAFTVGEHVAFGTNEYKPGSLTGDALIAHEVAHVVQQSGGGKSVAPMQGGDTTYNNLEDDADKSAEGALVSLWQGTNGALANIAENTMPRLRSGLRLSRCGSSSSNSPPCTSRTTAATPTKTVTVRHSHLWEGGTSSDFNNHLNYANQVYALAGINFAAGNPEEIDETGTKAASLLGTNGTLDVSRDPPRSSSYTAEETALMSHNSATGEITAYYIKEMDNVSLWGLVYRDSDALVLESTVSDRVLSHEMGHIFFGYGHPSNNDNIMAQSRNATGVDCLSDDQINDVRNSSLAT